MPPNYGRRADQTLKGEGYFGALQRREGGISTELSIGVDFGQGEMEIPTLVPTLTDVEVAMLLRMRPGQPTPPSIVDKAVAHARQRLAAGLSPFAGAGEARPRPGMTSLGDLVRGYQRDERRQP